MAGTKTEDSATICRSNFDKKPSKLRKLRRKTEKFVALSGLAILTLLLLTQCPPVHSLDFDSSLCRCENATHFGKPFVVLWNSPTEGCKVNFSVDVELEKHGILTNTNQTWDGEVITVFYNAQLGLYPYFHGKNMSQTLNGGMPQLINITEHLLQVSQHIIEKIPDPEYNGAAVIDWEYWRPVWETNFGLKRIYQTKSVQLVEKEYAFKKKKTEHSRKSRNVSLGKTAGSSKKIEQDHVTKEAKRRFENATRQLMEETIKLGRQLRPKALWGFYGFPSCYGNMTTGFQCKEKNKQWNNKLQWLYESSTALFPSIYLIENHVENHKFVEERLAEAFRVAFLVKNRTKTLLPVFAYLRPLYLSDSWSHRFKMLSEDDLENTIGQAADFGCAGLVLWGNHHDERTSRNVCQQYNNYVNKQLGPYISSLTEEVETCSERKCSSNGRCVESRSVALRNSTLLSDNGGTSSVNGESCVKLSNKTIFKSKQQQAMSNISIKDMPYFQTNTNSNNSEPESKNTKKTRLKTFQVNADHQGLNFSKVIASRPLSGRYLSRKEQHILNGHRPEVNSLISHNKTGKKTSKVKVNHFEGLSNVSKLRASKPLSDYLSGKHEHIPNHEQPVVNNGSKMLPLSGYLISSRTHSDSVSNGSSEVVVHDGSRSGHSSRKQSVLNGSHDVNINENTRKESKDNSLLEDGKGEGRLQDDNRSEEKGQHDGNVSEIETLGNGATKGSTNSTSNISAPSKTRKRPGYSATPADDTSVHIPGVYIILITVTLGGALLMTVIYVAIYYAVNVRGRSYEHTYDNNFDAHEDNPFALDDHDDNLWWNENADQKQKLLNNKNNKR